MNARTEKTLARTIDKLEDAIDIRAALEKVEPDTDAQNALLWDLTNRRLIRAETNQAVLFLLEEAREHGEPAAIAELCTRLPKKLTGYHDLLAGYPQVIDELLVSAWRRDPDAVLARAAAFPPPVKLGLTFVRFRAGEEISDRDRDRILTALAKVLAGEDGYFASTYDLVFRKDGEQTTVRLMNHQSLRDVAALLGRGDRWAEILLAEALDGEWTRVRWVYDALAIASAKDLARMLARGFDVHEDLQKVLELLEARTDDGPSLLAAARAVKNPDNEERPRVVQELFAHAAARRFAAAGQPIPEELDALIVFEYPSQYTPAGIAPAIAALAAIPAARVHARVRAKLELGYGYHSAVLGVVAHFDAGLLDAILARDPVQGYVQEVLLGAVGARGLEPIAASIKQLAPRLRPGRHLALLHALATAAEAGDAIDPRWDSAISFDRDGDRPIELWNSTDHELRERVLRHLPRERLESILTTALADSAHPERPFAFVPLDRSARFVDRAVELLCERYARVGHLGGTMKPGESVFVKIGAPAVEALCRHVHRCKGAAPFMNLLEEALFEEDFARVKKSLRGAIETEREALLRLAREAPGEKQRIYVLHVEHAHYPARAGTLSRTHAADSDSLFTLDLEEIPELEAWFPEARAITFSSPGARRARWSEATLRRTSAEQVAPGTPIAVTPVDVPRAIFDSPEDPRHKQLQRMVFGAAGHVLGAPIWIQGEDDDDEPGDWILQVNGALVPRANLGDLGSLYVFEDGVRFQCH